MLHTGMPRSREYFEKLLGALHMIWYRQIDEQHTCAQHYTPYQGVNTGVKTRCAEPTRKIQIVRLESVSFQ